MTAQELLYMAFRRIGQMRPGYQNSPELLADGLSEFKTFFDALNAKRTNAYSIPDYIYQIGSNTGLAGIYGPNVQYSVGPAFTFSGTTVSTSTTVAVTNTQGLNIGQSISGSGIPALTTIQGITTNTSITLSHAATASATVTITVSPSFAGPRPEAIIRMNLYMTSTSPTQPTRIPLAPISAEQWANISVIQITAVNVTTVFYYDPQFPQGVINVWPPLNGNALEIFTWGFLTPPVSLSTEMRVPPGYQDLIIKELAARLWPLCTHDQMVNKVTHQWICGQAAIARKAVQDVNAPSPRLVNDFAGGSRTNIGVSDWSLLLTGVPY